MQLVMIAAAQWFLYYYVVYNVDIMGICETFLDDNVADNEMCIEDRQTDKFIRPNVRVNRLNIVQDNWSRRLPLRQIHVASMAATFI